MEVNKVFKKNNSHFYLVLLPGTVLLAGLQLGCSNSSGLNPAQVPIGIERLTRLDQIYRVPVNVQVVGESSYDRTGGNDDGFSGAYSYLYRDEKGYVIFDRQGPGCVYQMWFTSMLMSFGLPYDLSFYPDGASPAVLTIPSGTGFSGETPGLPFPLVGSFTRSSGGLFSYLPICFQERLVIAASTLPTFYQVIAHLYPPGTEVPVFNGEEKVQEAAENLGRVGSDFLPEEKKEIEKSQVTVSVGEKKQLFELTGHGIIYGLKFTLEDYSEESLNSLYLSVFFDDAVTAQVLSPMGILFGSGFGPAEIRSRPIVMDPGARTLSCFFLMPFLKKAWIELENRGISPISISSEVSWVKDKPAPDFGYFHAQYREEKPTSPGADYLILDEKGQGQLVGVTLAMAELRDSHRNYLEGDHHIYLEGSTSPVLNGTGTEDYFEGGWYFLNGTFSLPTHGNPVHRSLSNGGDATGAYRFHLSDTIPFQSSIRFSIEHGPANDVEAEYASVVYYYLRSK